MARYANLDDLAEIKQLMRNNPDTIYQKTDEQLHDMINNTEIIVYKIQSKIVSCIRIAPLTLEMRSELGDTTSQAKCHNYISGPGIVPHHGPDVIKLIHYINNDYYMGMMIVDIKYRNKSRQIITEMIRLVLGHQPAFVIHAGSLDPHKSVSFTMSCINDIFVKHRLLVYRDTKTFPGTDIEASRWTICVYQYHRL